MTGRSRTSGRFGQKSQGVTDAGLARSDALSDDNDAVDRKPTGRTPPKSSAGNHELPDVSPAQFARDFRLTFGELPPETLKRSAKRLISRSRRRPSCSDPFAA